MTKNDQRLTWTEMPRHRGLTCDQYPKLQIIFNTNERRTELIVNNKILYKFTFNYFADDDEIREKFELMKHKAQYWWNNEYRTKRLNTQIKLWILGTIIDNSDIDTKETDGKYILFIFKRLINQQGGLTEPEIMALNIISNKYNVDNEKIPNVTVVHFEEEYKINKDFIITKNNSDKWVVILNDGEHRINLYTSPVLEDAFVFAAAKYSEIQLKRMS